MLQPMTAIVLTFNEEKRIARCLKSVAQVASQVLILDSFSKDRTSKVATEAWLSSGREAQDLAFVQREWSGFTEARNFTLSWLQTPWALWIDADEWIERDLEDTLKSFDWVNAPYDVYKIARQSYFLGRAIRHGGWYPDRKARLARSQKCVWKRGPRDADVHEDLFSLNQSERGLLGGHLGHEPFLNLQEQNDTNWRYSSLLAEGLAKEYLSGKKKPKNYFWVCLKVFIKFFENYFFKLGILDGWQGYVIAKGSAQSLFWRLSKAKNLYIEATKS